MKKGMLALLVIGACFWPPLQAQDWKKEVQKAAEKGNIDSQEMLGSMYLLGKGVPQDDKQAVAWSRKAAEQGHVLAQYELMYRTLSGKRINNTV